MREIDRDTLGFTPAERLMLLTIAVDELPEGVATDCLRAITSAAMTVVRQMQGRATTAEAYAHVARANETLRQARREVGT